MTTPSYNVPLDDNGNPLERSALERAKFYILPNGSVSIYQIDAYDDLIVNIEDDLTYTYIGKAAPGSTAGQAVWRISRVTDATGVKLFAESTVLFDKTWAGRTGYTYG